MKFCDSESVILLTAIGKGIHRFGPSAASSVRVEMRVLNAKRSVLSTDSKTFGPLDDLLGEGEPFAWRNAVIGEFAIPEQHAGAARYVSVRLLVDWSDDGKGYFATTYKTLRLRR